MRRHFKGDAGVAIQLADRMYSVKKSFIREILKVTEDSSIISFAGGLPNPKSFPVEEVAAAAAKVLKEDGESALQYSTTEGYPPLRKYIAKRYARYGIKADAGEILITTGSQQGLDLIGKVFLNKGDTVAVERPTYLAALQSFGMYEPGFIGISLMDDGIDVEAMKKALADDAVKLLYMVPSFQNPTGITYSHEKRKQVAEALRETKTVLVEDNPYGDIRFMGEDLPPMKRYVGGDAIIMGTFSKTVSPGMRLGWLYAPGDIMEKLITAKQAADLHTSYFVQRVVYQYLLDNDVEKHIKRIRRMYKAQRDAMVSALERYFPDGVYYTRPEGGMFLWVTLPEGISSIKLFEIAIKNKVVFVPGYAFFVDGSGQNTLRLNYSSSNEEQIEEGIKRLAKAFYALKEAKHETIAVKG
ncbi:PLP-dependent aminotransferase family protein [Methanocella conradii]|uniref:aminotransferase-like domain-containing protein n=1 Tax=Methanocella conradii TaxID=1175444 RepID=UPI0024B39F81|nr:PLP-dependent aminotransferase family protein [Methanocella conradii]MDI6897578.1 PLP-dependent aminotransferase family protein [Methanocella conradii]